MALKNLFDMVKADKYTADGREELIKAQEAETEDTTYNIGEISEKTGLQKTANGWVKPKKGAAPAKKEPGKATTAQRMKAYVDAMNKKNGEFAGSYKKSKAKSDAIKQEQLAQLNRANTDISEWEESAKSDAKAYNENMVVLQNAEGKTTIARESSPDVEKAEAHGYKKMSLVRPDGSVKKHGGNAESKAAAGNNLQWNESPSGRVWTSKTPGGKNLTVIWNREKNGEEWYSRSDSDTKYKSKEEAMNAPIGPEKKRLTWAPNTSVSEKFNDIIKLGAKSEDRTKRPGSYIGPKVQENYLRRALRNRLGATEESIDDLLEGMDDETRKNAFNGFMENYSTDAAPRVLTGDTRIRVRKA